MYHFSAPSTSLNPSLELSLPLRPLLVIYLPSYLVPSPADEWGWACDDEVPGPGERARGDVEWECVRGECSEVRAAAVALDGALVDVDVVIVRGWEGDVVC